MQHKTNSLGSRRSRVKEMLIAILFDMPTGLSGLIDGLSRLVKLPAVPKSSLRPKSALDGRMDASELV